ncbi:MBL fold metallo-hydrolase [Spirillospora sp. NPDC048823]|uniref:MBL fold metallo-hydrolase n=1 Tax=unclassified Spirillospora TaxID=2642701 RepID=UPI00371C0587
MYISRPAPDVVALTDAVPVPGIGFLPVNAYVLYAKEPVLIDTGLRASTPEFLEEVWSLVEPADLRWVCLTHPGHAESVLEILEAAPDALLVTTFLGERLLSLERRIPPDRVFLLNPGEWLDVGDRRLKSFRLPVYDSPATTGLFDELTGTYFSSDCFGAPMTTGDLVQSDDIGAVPSSDLVAGQRLWAAVDCPELVNVDRDAFLSRLALLSDLDPPVVLASHLPSAHHKTETLLDTLANAQDAPSYAGPGQAAFERMLHEMEPTRA